VVTSHFELSRGTWFPQHVHVEAHQLVWAVSGVLAVRADGAAWVLPLGVGLWLPNGVAHETGATARSTMLGIYIDPRRCPISWPTPTVVAIDGLQRELLLHLSREDLGDFQREHAEATLFDTLRPIRSAHVDVPDLRDPRAAAVAAALVRDPADFRSLEAWGQTVGASGRTLTRIWQAETGMAFDRWRRRLRVRESLPLLASGMSVASTSRRVGYQSSSAFVGAFRREVGATPGTVFCTA
jgi:AraC-like DNA-binding protein